MRMLMLEEIKLLTHNLTKSELHIWDIIPDLCNSEARAA